MQAALIVASGVVFAGAVVALGELAPPPRLPAVPGGHHSLRVRARRSAVSCLVWPCRSKARPFGPFGARRRPHHRGSGSLPVFPPGPAPVSEDAKETEEIWLGGLVEGSSGDPDMADPPLAQPQPFLIGPTGRVTTTGRSGGWLSPNRSR